MHRILTKAVITSEVENIEEFYSFIFHFVVHFSLEQFVSLFLFFVLGVALHLIIVLNGRSER